MSHRLGTMKGVLAGLVLLLSSIGLDIKVGSTSHGLAFEVDSSLPHPTNVCPTSQDGSVRLDWDSVSSDVVTGVMSQYRNVGTSEWNDGPTLSDVATTHIEIAGANRTEYEYRLAYLGASGRSEWGGNCLFAWGRNRDGQLGDGTKIDSPVPVRVQAESLVGQTATALTSGFGLTCALLESGSIACWGESSYSAYPTPGGHRYTDIKTLTGRAICGLVDDGTVDCWGFLSSYTPSDGRYVVKIAVGANHACAVLNDNSVHCWGDDNAYGQIGNGTTIPSMTPVEVTGGGLDGHSVKEISVGAEHSCAILDTNQVACWGNNQSLQLGSVAPSGQRLVPTLTATGALSGRIPVSLSLGFSSTCALTSDGVVACWGMNGAREFPNGSSTASGYTPTAEVRGDLAKHRATFISNSSDRHACALLDNNSVTCWGSNQYGQLGNGLVTGPNYRFPPSTIPWFKFDRITTAYGGHTVARWSGVASPGRAASAPTSVTASNASGQNVSLVWKEPVSTGAASITGYHIERSSDAGRTWSDRITVGVVTSTTLAMPRDDYWMFRVRAVTTDSISPGEWKYSGEVLVKTEVRTTKSNVKVTFLTPSGAPLVGSTVKWRTPDGLLKGAQSLTTDDAGSVVSQVIATGPIVFTLTGGSIKNSKIEVKSATFTTVVLRSGRAITVRSPLPPSVTTRTVALRMPDGSPVPDASIDISGGLGKETKTGIQTGRRTFTATWSYPDWPESHVSDASGTVTVTGFDVQTVGNDVTAHFSDQFIDQTAYGSLTSRSQAIVFEQMPVVRIVTGDLPEVDVGTSVNVTVIAEDGTGDPIDGVDLVFSEVEASLSSASSASIVRSMGSTCTSSMKGKTNSLGRKTFKVCASATGKWRADGKGIVASRPVTLSVRPKKLKVGSSLALTSVLASPVPSKGIVSVAISKKSKKFCSYSKLKFRGMSAGTCRASVVVKVRGVTVSRTNVVISIVR